MNNATFQDIKRTNKSRHLNPATLKWTSEPISKLKSHLKKPMNKSK